MRLAAFVLTAVLGFAATAQAESYRKGVIEIGQPWSRPAAKSFNGAGYLSITNHGARPETLTGIDFPDASRVELHQTRMAKGMASMSAMSRGVVVPPGATVKLEPGGAHAMLLRLKEPLRAGQRRAATLHFASGLRIPVEFAIQAEAPRAAVALQHIR